MELMDLGSLRSIMDLFGHPLNEVRGHSRAIDDDRLHSLCRSLLQLSAEMS
jgi:hypothetical protein